MTDVKGYMTFAAQTPISTQTRPHPAFAPMMAPATFDASGWADCYHIFESREVAEAEAKSDHEVLQTAVDDGDLEDMADDVDVVLPVTVTDEGSVVVYDDRGANEIARHTAQQIFESFGMDVPVVPSGDTPCI